MAVIDSDFRGVESLDQPPNQVKDVSFLVFGNQSRKFRLEKLHGRRNRKKERKEKGE